MAIIKLDIKAESVVTGTITITTVTSVVPTVNRFTATVVIGNVLGGVTTIPEQNFTDDSGTSVPIDGLTVPTSSGYWFPYLHCNCRKHSKRY
jgi:hypothetical protein